MDERNKNTNTETAKKKTKETKEKRKMNQVNKQRIKYFRSEIEITKYKKETIERKEESYKRTETKK
jgi:hypothetical protein